MPHQLLISEFREILEREFGCVFKRESLPVGGGVAFEFHYIERDLGPGKVLTFPFYDYDPPNRILHKMVLKSACRHLGLDCTRFGLTPADLEDPE